MSQLFHVSSSPHTRSKYTTSNIMLDVIIALIPASVFGIWNFGLSALIILLLSILSCVISEVLYDYFIILKNKGNKKLSIKEFSVLDYSAVLTGLLLGMNLPSTVPYFIPVLGGIFAIIVVKQLFGGLGQNIVNPALAARCFLLISFTGRMTNFELDGISSATPLQELKTSGQTIEFMQLLIGNKGGVIGETSVICLIIGAAYLLVKKVISFKIPAAYIISFAIFVFIFGEDGFNINFMLSHLLSGGLILGAFFMATDYVTSPITPKGQIIFGILIGLLTGIFRIFGASAEGASYAILLGNICVPLIEKISMPIAFGKEKSHGKK